MELNVIDTNQLFLQKERVNQIRIRCKIGIYSDWKSQNRDHHSRTFLPCPSMRVPPPPHWIMTSLWLLKKKLW